MLSFLAMLFTLRVGLGATPVDGAVASLRQESLAVAARAAEANTVPAHVMVPLPAVTPVTEQRWEVSPQRVLTQRDWRRLLGDTLQSEALANAATWFATQPVRVSVGREKVVLTYQVETP